jgi:RNA polymerase sigma-70 factor (ECF subfamily)
MDVNLFTVRASNTDERAAVERAKSGDRDAFGGLVLRYQDGVFALALRLVSMPDEARDIAAETFVRAWRSLQGFRQDADFRTWLFRIAVNLSRSHLRRRYLYRRFFFRAETPEDEDEEPREERWADPAPDGDPLRQAEQRALARELEKARRKLSAREREVFTLKYDEDMKISEISRVLDIAESTVKVLLFRAAKKMAEQLKDRV